MAARRVAIVIIVILAILLSGMLLRGYMKVEKEAFEEEVSSTSEHLETQRKETTTFREEKSSATATKESALPEFSKLEKTHFSKVERAEKAHWIRVWITWGGIEREEGVYDFSYPDHIVRKAGENNALLLVTIEPFAEWDQDRCHGEEYYGNMPMPGGKARIKVGKPCNMEDYREFLGRLVERYDGDGIDDMPGLIYPVKYWEVVNEPGMQGKDPSGLKFFYGTPQEYLEILKVSYQTIKGADPEAKVLMGGMAGMHDQFVKFWDPIMDEAGNYFDIANIHSIDTDERREDMFVLKFRRFLREHGIENKPIWITEAQFGSLGFEWEKGRKLSVEEMDKLIVRAAVFSLALGADKIFFISDNWRSESTMKVYRTLVEKLNRFDSVEVVDQRYVENKGKDSGATSIRGCYKFAVENKTVYVVWGEGKLPEAIKGRVKVTDIYGNEEIVEADEVELTDSPIYVEEL